MVAGVKHISLHPCNLSKILSNNITSICCDVSLVRQVDVIIIFNFLVQPELYLKLTVLAYTTELGKLFHVLTVKKYLRKS